VGTELRPLSVKCNIRCRYCYQNPQRDATEQNYKYDMAAMKAAVEREGRRFTLFGGEPLLVPERDLAELWSWGLIRFGGNGIQTNGSLINERHITMFKRYRVSVGISIDGPGELNDIRWAGSLDATRRTTERIEAAIRRLCEEKVYPSLIITLHRGNATKEKLPILLDWLRLLEKLGVRSVRLHILEVDSPSVREMYTLSDEDNLRAFLYFAEAESSFTTLRFDVFEDMRRLLLGKDNSTTCIWNACDQYTTAAVCGVEGNGQSSNCGRTNKDGIDYVKGATPGYERYIALYETPYEQGGCKGCRFFAMCKGQCPGTAIDNDWRNRSEHCRIWMALFEHFERKLLANGDEPLSVSNLRTTLEQELVALWASGKTSSLQRILERGESADLAGDAVPSEEPTLSSIASSQPEFTRSVWVSDRAASEWEDKIKRIAATWRRLEWRTVVKGVRKSALMLLSANELESLRSALGQVNMGVSVLQVLKHRHPNADDGIVFRVAVGTPKALKSFRVAWVKKDHDAMGELLGYPRCCRSAFNSEYLRSGLQDSTWQAAGGCSKPDGESHALEVKGPPQVNALLAKIGVRLIPHIPCSFTCEESLRLARQFQRVADTAEEEESIEMALEMLAWPMAWSAVNGIAEIKTPIMKVNYGTDRVPQRRSVQYLGERYPEAAASGLQFPFRILHATR
jgi:radical SAM protein with 4Fe4S-binding SPASM domain